MVKINNLQVYFSPQRFHDKMYQNLTEFLVG